MVSVKVLGALLLFLGGAASQAKSKKRQRSARLRSTDKSEIDHFVIEYGDGSNWYLGMVGQDGIDFGSATAPDMQFGLIEFSVLPIGNPFPAVSAVPGPPSTDGILGLNPGCIDDRGCPNGNDDVISTLVRSGSLKSYGFTMCHSEHGGGKLFLGLPQSQDAYPQGTSWFRLFPFQTQIQNKSEASRIWYTLAPPSDGSLSYLFFGGQVVGNVSAEELSKVSYIFDSGTMGLEIPPQAAHAVFGNISRSWLNSTVGQRVFKALNNGTLPSEEEMIQHLSSGDVNGLPLKAEDAAALGAMVPDFVMQVQGANLTVSGATYLYQDTDCAGTYSVSWREGDPSAGTVAIGGTSFLWGKTVTHDVSDATAPRLGVLDAAGSCTVDYSQNGQILEMGGSQGQILTAGVYTTKVSLGNPVQTFTVQLDTGSDDLLLQSSDCAEFNMSCVRFHWSRSNRMNFTSTHICNATPADNLNEHALAEKPQLNVSAAQFERFASQSLQPRWQCEAQRKACGKLSLFNAAASSTFEAVPKGSNVPSLSYAHPAPEMNKSGLTCEACPSKPEFVFFA